MGARAHTNTNPMELGRRLAASGPMGFIAAVYNTLRRLGRPYLVADRAPEFLLASGDLSQFGEMYRRAYPEGETPGVFLQVPHAIVHRYEKQPARMTGSISMRRVASTGHQLRSYQVEVHGRPLPDTPPLDEAVESLLVDWRGDEERPPLWNALEEVPDIIRPYVEQNPLVEVAVWHYDVWVDFVCLATTGTWVEQMVTDLELILHMLHHRSLSGASNLHGWYAGTTTQVPQDMVGMLAPQVVGRTVSWRLRQSVAYAMPAVLLKEIRLELAPDLGA